MNELSFEACRVYMIVNAVSVVLIIYYLFTRLDLHLNGDKDTLYFSILVRTNFIYRNSFIHCKYNIYLKC